MEKIKVNAPGARGKDAFYEFDYWTQEAVIYKVVRWEVDSGSGR